MSLHDSLSRGPWNLVSPSRGSPREFIDTKGSIKQKKVRNSASQLMDYFVVFIKIGKFENQNNLHFNSSKSFVSDCVVKN